MARRFVYHHPLAFLLFVGRLADSFFFSWEGLLRILQTEAEKEKKTSVRSASFLELHKYHRSRELSHTVCSHIPEYETFLLLHHT
jgi:hypothetical protein